MTPAPQLDSQRPSPEKRSETFPAELRAYWRAIVVDEVMRCAALCNLTPYRMDGWRELTPLPTQVHAIVVRLVDELVRKACTEEKRAGRLPGTRRRIVSVAHDAMKPFARRGEFYVEHMIGDAATQKEFELRTGAGDAERTTWDILDT